jgi:hypothetical protein
MAFDFKYLGRIQQTVALDKTTNPIGGEDSVPMPQGWVYNGTATGGNASAAQLAAANYFITAYGYLNVGDYILASANDPGFVLLSVATSAVGGVTTTLRSV